VLLQIFSLLDVKTLENVQQVCDRWNFLANTPELWIFKCKKLGENENLGQIEAFLINELTNDEDIDWKLAYMELLEFIDLLKKNYFDKFSESNKLSELNSRMSDDLASKHEKSFARSTRGGMYLNYI
jgi:hypothetical protein